LPYEYSRDNTTVGDTRYYKGTYEFYQKGLLRLRELLQRWNKDEAEPPYQPEVRDLTEMIDWAAPKLEKLGERDEVYISGVSVGSLRYLKAAALIQVLEAEEHLERDRGSLPDGVVAATRKRIGEMKQLAQVPILSRYDPADVLWEVAPLPRERTASVEGGYEWDLFVSYASEDRDPFVNELVAALTSQGLRCWYDQFELRLGDPLRRSIERGLARSQYGVIIISPRFLAKDWPQRELDGMAALEVNGRKVILPIWHDLDAGAVRGRSPMLADRVAVSSGRGLAEVVRAILAVVRTRANGPAL